MIKSIKTHIFLILLLTITLTSVFSLWWWMKHEFESKKTEFISLQKEVAQLKFRELYAKSFAYLLSEINEQAQELLNLFISEYDIPTILESLEQNDVLRKTNVEISSLNSDDERIMLKINGVGTFVIVVKALDYLTNIPRVAFLQSFTLNYIANYGLWKYEAEVILLKK